MDDTSLVMNLYWTSSLLTATLGLKLSASQSGTKQARQCHYCCHNMCLICFYPDFALAVMFSPQFSSVWAGRQQMWVRQQEFGCCSCFKFEGAEYCCWLLTLLLQKIYFVLCCNPNPRYNKWQYKHHYSAYRLVYVIISL